MAKTFELLEKALRQNGGYKSVKTSNAVIFEDSTAPNGEFFKIFKNGECFYSPTNSIKSIRPLNADDMKKWIKKLSV